MNLSQCLSIHLKSSKMVCWSATFSRVHNTSPDKVLFSVLPCARCSHVLLATHFYCTLGSGWRAACCTICTEKQKVVCGREGQQDEGIPSIRGLRRAVLRPCAHCMTHVHICWLYAREVSSLGLKLSKTTAELGIGGFKNETLAWSVQDRRLVHTLNIWLSSEMFMLCKMIVSLSSKGCFKT